MSEEQYISALNKWREAAAAGLCDEDKLKSVAEWMSENHSITITEDTPSEGPPVTVLGVPLVAIKRLLPKEVSGGYKNKRRRTKKRRVSKKRRKYSKKRRVSKKRKYTKKRN